MVKNACYMLKTPYTGRPGLYPTVSAQFTLLKCAPRTAKNCKRTLNLLIWGFRVIQGHRCWHHSKACHMSVPICNCSYTRRANSGKTTLFDAPLRRPSWT